MIIDQTLKKLCENAAHLYILMDIRNDEIVYANPAFHSIFGPDILPSGLLLLVHPDDRQYVLENYEYCKSGQTIEDFECRIWKDNLTFMYKISAVCIHTDDGQSVIGCRAEDVTDLTAYIRTLNDHNKKKNSILNIIGHDLMEPIGIIQALSGLMGNLVDKQHDEKMQQYIQMVNKTSKKCINLIRNFINDEFLETAAVKLVKHRIDLVCKMKDLIDEYKNAEVGMQKHFSLQASDEIIYVEIDEDKFFQIINNLISNSLKFTKKQGKILISLSDNGSSVTISVADNGIGIPERHHQELFEKFTPARRNGLHGEQSIGLGMSIIKTIVEWHEGKIWFFSKENVGTTFYIEIPKASDTDLKFGSGEKSKTNIN